jgi:hypothetical protein
MEASIFGFAEYISALALLVIVYTIADVRYQFRIAVAPIPLFNSTYILITVIGFGTLLTNFWFSDAWHLSVNGQINISLQVIFGASFLLLALVWINFAFIRPPKFSKYNYKRFHDELYKIILRGSDDDLKIISNEIGRSAKSIIRFSNERKDKNHNTDPDVCDYAKNILMLIGNRKFCRNIILTSPNTAMAFFDAMVAEKNFDVPVRQFSVNISTEAIINKDSILYHEDEGYRSGLLGYQKPFSKMIYGNYRLVENLAVDNGSPLDVDYKLSSSWDAEQLKVYCRLVLITLESYINEERWPQHSFALTRALHYIQNSCLDIYKLNENDLACLSTDAAKRLDVVVDFIKKGIDVLDKSGIHPTKLRLRDGQKDMYDLMADVMYEIITSVASVERPPETCWWIQHNVVWGSFFKFSRNKTSDIIQFKLRRLIYDEIIQLNSFPNYGSSRVLGYCLNVMGLKLYKNDRITGSYYPLHCVIIAWVKYNYLQLVAVQPDVAESCIFGWISFEAKKSRLVKTYIKGLNLEAPKDYLELKKPKSKKWF